MKLWLIIALAWLVPYPGIVAAQTPPRLTAIATPQGTRTTLVRAPSPGPGPVPAFGTPAVNGVVNGDFASGLDGWTVVESGGSAAPGGVTPEDDQAQFLEGDSFLVSLQQTLVVPGFATTVTFDLTLVPGFDTASGFLPDAFEISLLDGSQLPLVEPWTIGATSCFNLQEDGTASMGPEVTWDGTTVSVDIVTVIPGSTVTLYLDFVNADLDTLGGVRADNVVLTVDVPAGSFVRGDTNGDGAVDGDDPPTVLDLLLGGGGVPLDCTGLLLEEVADGNDNEFLTVADYLAVRDAAELGSILPAPSVCGFDPTEDLGGFDVVDSSFVASAGNVMVEPPTGVVDRDVFIPVLVDIPQAATGLTLILDYDESVLTPFDPLQGEGDPFVSGLGSTAVRSEPGRLVFLLWASSSGETVREADPGVLQEVGTLQFHLADFVVFPAVSWVPEADVDGRLWRATVVDPDFVDHHPDLQVGEGQFARGDANGDLSVNLVDAVFTLNYMFAAGELIPCFDAADSDNNSSLGLADPVYLLLFLFSMGTPLPPPYPGCGFDEGPIDTLDCAESPCQP